jgi:ribosomal protein S18 acetylase RimI-like enzyme
VTVRKATHADVDDIARTFAAAFDDDPITVLLFPPSTRHRADRVRRFFAVTLKLYLAHDQTWTTADRRAAAVWAPPGQWKTRPADIVRTVPAMARILGRNLPRGLGVLSRVETAHPHEPHYYLATLGTDPPQQGRGLGGAVLAPVLARCDEEGVGAYLESSKERNVPYYRRFGFEVTKEIDVGHDTRVWGMWRDPR